MEKYHTWRAMPQNHNVRERRLPRKGTTTICQERINLRHRIDELSKIIINNFSADDFWISFTLAPEFADISVDKFKKVYANMIRVLRTYYRKKGYEFKYVSVQENLTGTGRMHGHILIQKVMDSTEMKELLAKAWPLGNCNIKTYYGTASDARRLASYMVKEKPLNDKFKEKETILETIRKNGAADAKELLSIEKEIAAERSYICTSKNLIRTKPTRTLITQSETFDDKIQAPAGYHILDEYSGNGRTRGGFNWQYAVFEADTEASVPQSHYSDKKWKRHYE